MPIRPALQTDLEAIFSIYDKEVLEGTATFDTVPYAEPQRLEWLKKHEHPRYPALVLEDSGLVVAWGTLSPWSDRRAYDRTAESSVYVRDGYRRRGFGLTMLRMLIEVATGTGVYALLARITSESAGSIALHESVGFVRVGTLRRVGEKFGRVLDVDLLELLLDGHAVDPELG
jgi:phosphinothricin acetyltransferase